MNWRDRKLQAVGAAFLAVGFFLGGAIRQSGIFGEATAAWVQAIGSIAAIYAAITVGQAAVAASNKAREEDRDGVRAAVDTFAYQAVGFTMAVRQSAIDGFSADAPGELKMAHEFMERIGKEAQALPLHLVGDADFMDDYRLLIANVHSMTSGLAGAYRHLLKTGKISQPLVDLVIDAATDALEDFTRLYPDMAASLVTEINEGTATTAADARA